MLPIISGLAGGLENEAQALLVIQVVPHPVEENGSLVLDSKNRAQVYDEPQHPCRQPAELESSYLGHGFLAPYGGHCAQVAIAEGARRLPTVCPYKVIGHGRGLLHGHLSQLRMAVRIGWVALYKALIADGIDVLHAFHTAETVGKNAAPTANGISRQAFYLVGNDTADPYHRFGGNAGPVFQNHFFVNIIHHLAVLSYMHSHAFQVGFGLLGRLWVHALQ